MIKFIRYAPYAALGVLFLGLVWLFNDWQDQKATIALQGAKIASQMKIIEREREAVRVADDTIKKLSQNIRELDAIRAEVRQDENDPIGRAIDGLRARRASNNR